MKRLNLFALTALGLASVFLLPGKGAAYSNQNVPLPTGANQVPQSLASTLYPNGFTWTPVSLPYSTNGTQIAVGGNVDANSRLSVNPTGTAENGISVTLPSGATGNALTVKTSTGGTIWSVGATGYTLLTNPSSSGNIVVAGVSDGSQYANFNLRDNTNGSPTTNPYWYFSYKTNRHFSMNYFNGSTYPAPMDLDGTGNAVFLGNVGANGNLTAGGTIVGGGALTANSLKSNNFVTAAALNLTSIAPYSAAVTLSYTSSTALCNGTFTVTLPAANANKGLLLWVKNIGTGTITIASAGGTVDGATTQTLSTQYQCRCFESDGTNWNIVSGYL